MRVRKSGVRENNFATTATGVYPLVKIDYALIPTSGISKQRAKSLVSLLQFASGAGQQQLPVGYFPLPTALKSQIATAIKSLQTKIINVVPPTSTTQPPEQPYVPPVEIPVDTLPATTAPQVPVVSSPDPLATLPGASPAIAFPVVLSGAFVSGVGVLSRNKMKEKK